MYHVLIFFVDMFTDKDIHHINIQLAPGFYIYKTVLTYTDTHIFIKHYYSYSGT